MTSPCVAVAVAVRCLVIDEYQHLENARIRANSKSGGDDNRQPGRQVNLFIQNQIIYYIVVIVFFSISI